jgi:anthranilate phosphoribosyltransferase
MFAPIFHPAMKYASTPRREIGIRTVFNILGPLTNPAGAQAQMLGVADDSLLMKMAEVLKLLGCHHALVVHGDDGLDEITPGGRTTVCELKEGIIKGYSIDPEELGFPRVSVECLRGGSPQENAKILTRVLNGERGPHRDIVLLNAAAALVAGEKAQTIKDGVALAKEAIDSGRALEKLERLIKLSQSL